MESFRHLTCSLRDDKSTPPHSPVTAPLVLRSGTAGRRNADDSFCFTSELRGVGKTSADSDPGEGSDSVHEVPGAVQLHHQETPPLQSLRTRTSPAAAAARLHLRLRLSQSVLRLPGGLWQMLGVSRSLVVRQQPDQPRLRGLLRDAGGGVANAGGYEQQQPEEALHPGGTRDITVTSPQSNACSV